jgi:hypothetical protein
VENEMKKIFSYLLFFSFLNYTGCYSSKVVGKEKFLSGGSKEPINNLTIVTNEDKRIEIHEVTFQVFDDTLYAEGVNKTNTTVYGQLIDVKIALEDIQFVEIDEFSEAKTIGCIISLTGLVVLIIGLIAAANSFDKSSKGCGGTYHGFNLEPD